MKYLFFILSFTALCCSSSKTTDEWTDLAYDFKSGSVPPPYYYTYTIIINISGEGNIRYQQDYEDSNFWLYTFKLTTKQLSELKKYVVDNNLLLTSRVLTEQENKPIGGSLKTLRITLKQDANLDQMPPTIQYPAFLKDKELENILSNLYKMLDGYVPKETWDEINNKKENYINSYKK